MSLYSSHRIPREEKRFPSHKRGFGFFYNSSWVPDNERGFWYRGCKKRLHVHWQNYHLAMWRAFAKGAITQIYNTSPLLVGLLADAEHEHQEDQAPA